MTLNILESITNPVKLQEAPLEIVKAVQIELIRIGLFNDRVDGIAGNKTMVAFHQFKNLTGLGEFDTLGQTTAQKLLKVKSITPKQLHLGNDLAARIIKYCLAQNYSVAVGDRLYNLVYVEGVDADGKPNADRLNEWNDRRIVIEIVGGTPKIVGNWLATSEPGAKYTYSPLNPEGAARIAFGQYKSWKVGIHKDHEALVQVANIKVHRDRNQDGSRAGDPVRIGCYGVNQHWGYDMTRVDGASAGCLVGQSRQGHREFMALIKQDQRYQANHNYLFDTAVIPGDDLAKRFPA